MDICQYGKNIDEVQDYFARMEWRQNDLSVSFATRKLNVLAK